MKLHPEQQARFCKQMGQSNRQTPAARQTNLQSANYGGKNVDFALQRLKFFEEKTS